MKLKLSIILILLILVSACTDESNPDQGSSESGETSSDDVGVLQPYIDDPVMETRSNGVRKLGLYSETNGTGTFKDCKTGKSYAVIIDDSPHSLHTTYTTLSHNQGQLLLVELIVEVETNKDDVEALQPKKLLGVIHKETCD